MFLLFLLLSLVSPELQSVTPNALIAGSAGTMITVSGGGFNSSSSIVLNTDPNPIPTTFVDASTLQGVIPAFRTASPITIYVSVLNGDTGETTITLVSTSTTTISGQIALFEPAGTPLRFPINGDPRSTFT